MSRAAVFTTIYNGGVIMIPLDTVDNDSSGSSMGDVANNHIKMPSAGFYLIQARTYLSTGAAGTAIDVWIYVNGVQRGMCRTAAAVNGDGMVEASLLWYAAAGDVAQIAASSSINGNVSTNSGVPYRPVLSVMRVG
jgi:hypothetical protein